MFTVYCEGHGTNLLMGHRQIVRLVNHPDGIELHWRCYLGHEGTCRVGRRHRPGASRHLATVA